MEYLRGFRELCYLVLCFGIMIEMDESPNTPIGQSFKAKIFLRVFSLFCSG